MISKQGFIKKVTAQISRDIKYKGIESYIPFTKGWKLEIIYKWDACLSEPEQYEFYMYNDGDLIEGDTETYADQIPKALDYIYDVTIGRGREL